jgi:hypothetical protein
MPDVPHQGYDDWRAQAVGHIIAAADQLTAAMSLYRGNDEEDTAHALGITVAALEHFREVEAR